MIGYAIADPIATALGFLVLFATATGGLPLLVVGVVIWVIGARSQRCQARTTT